MGSKNRKVESIGNMTHEEMKEEMAIIITKDIMRFVEVVVKKRISLFVDEIYNGIAKEKKS